MLSERGDMSARIFAQRYSQTIHLGRSPMQIGADIVRDIFWSALDEGFIIKDERRDAVISGFDNDQYFVKFSRRQKCH